MGDKHRHEDEKHTPDARLRRIEQYAERADWFLRVLITRNERQGEQLMATLAEYEAQLVTLGNEVARNTSVDESAALVMTALTAKIQELINNSGGADIPVAQLQALTDAFKASTDTLATKVAENTPSGGEPPVDPSTDPSTEPQSFVGGRRNR